MARSPEINIPPLPTGKEMVDVDIGSVPVSGKDSIPIEPTVNNIKKEGFVVAGAIAPVDAKAGSAILINPENILKGGVAIPIATPEIVK
jgi:hypothetical protein